MPLEAPASPPREPETEEDEEEEEEFVVERIMKKKIVRSKPVYLIKWEGFPNSDNTWEPLENLDCEEKLAEFEEQLKMKQQLPLESHKRGEFCGFERGLHAERVEGARQVTGGNLQFLMKWQDNEEPDFVNAEDADENCPRLVIDFYEKHLLWTRDRPSL